MSDDARESSRDRGAVSHEAAPSPALGGDKTVDLDVSWLVPADLGAVDALARLQVAVSRSGRRLQLHGANGGLVELLEFVGLSDVVHLCSCCRASAVRCEPPMPGS
jgi:ABC-type transporter Mla MlaB component